MQVFLKSLQPLKKSNFMSTGSYKMPNQFLLQFHDIQKQINLKMLFI